MPLPAAVMLEAILVPCNYWQGTVSGPKQAAAGVMLSHSTRGLRAFEVVEMLKLTGASLAMWLAFSKSQHLCLQSMNPSCICRRLVGHFKIRDPMGKSPIPQSSCDGWFPLSDLLSQFLGCFRHFDKLIA